jgi:hypothetical protein
VIERLARRHLLPVLPGFVGRRSLVYRRPIEYFLCGLSFDTSSFASSRIYVQAFVQPLFVREGHLWYTFGERLGDNEFWDVDEDEPDPTFAAIAEVARRDALPLFEQLESLDRFCEQVPVWAEAEPKKLLSLQSLDDPVAARQSGTRRSFVAGRRRGWSYSSARLRQNGRRASTPLRSGWPILSGCSTL